MQGSYNPVVVPFCIVARVSTRPAASTRITFDADRRKLLFPMTQHRELVRKTELHAQPPGGMFKQPWDGAPSFVHHFWDGRPKARCVKR
jgi:hypothetical protein